MSKMGEQAMEHQQEEEAYQADMENAMQERYAKLIYALRECYSMFVSQESLDTLIFETGAKREDVYEIN